jgi:hypothetical protein
VIVLDRKYHEMGVASLAAYIVWAKEIGRPKDFRDALTSLLVVKSQNNREDKGLPYEI